MSVRVSVELPEDAFSALRTTPEDFVKEMRLAAAVKWYELRQISQERAAEIAAVSRSDFIAALARFGATPFQYEAKEALGESEQ